MIIIERRTTQIMERKEDGWGAIRIVERRADDLKDSNNQAEGGRFEQSSRKRTTEIIEQK